jgi:hypothetical protein
MELESWDEPWEFDAEKPGMFKILYSDGDFCSTFLASASFFPRLSQKHQEQHLRPERPQKSGLYFPTLVSSRLPIGAPVDTDYAHLRYIVPAALGCDVVFRPLPSISLALDGWPVAHLEVPAHHCSAVGDATHLNHRLKIAA